MNRLRDALQNNPHVGDIRGRGVMFGIEIVTEDDGNFCWDSSSTTSTKPPATFELTPNDKIWIYVPQPSQNQPADENHPLLQSYVDTVLQGCLEWGGKAMGIDFVLSTDSWSPYFLNDTPSSRRPWLL